MKSIIFPLIVICIASFFSGMIMFRRLLSSGEITPFNFFTIQRVSEENRVLKKRTLIGFSIFGISILFMLILTGIYGPVKA